MQKKQNQVVGNTKKITPYFPKAILITDLHTSRELKKKKILIRNINIEGDSLKEEEFRQILKNIPINSSIRRVQMQFYFFPFGSVGLKRIRETLKPLQSFENFVFGSFNQERVLSLENKVRKIDDSNLQTLGKILRYSNTLKTLELNFHRTQISYKGVRNVVNNIRYLSSLQSFVLNLKDSYSSRDGLEMIEKVLKCTPMLQTLDLILDESVKNSDLQKFVQSFCHVKLLRSFKLDLRNSMNITLVDAFKGLQFVPLLQNLNLDFSSCSISEKGIISFSNELKNLTKLQNLVLSFFYCKKLSDSGFKAFFQNLSFNTSLKALELDLRHCLIKGSLVKMAESLKSCPLFSSLKLQFLQCDASATDFKSFFQNLSLLKKLEFLQLKLDSCRFLSDLALKPLWTSLSSLKLKTLEIDLDGKEITNGSLKNFQDIAKTSTLNKLNLSLSEIDHFDEIGIMSISKALLLLTKLQELSLSFVSCENISNKGFLELSKGFKNLTLLTKLSLDFYEGGPFVDQGIKGLSNAISNITKLEVLYLGFNRSEEFTNHGLIFLGKALRTLLFLKDFTLYLTDWEQVSRQKLLELCEGIE